MSFVKRNRSWIGLTAAFALVLGGAHMAGWSGCGGNCPISAIFGSSTAYAGPGCCSASKAEGAACTGKTEATTASAKTCSKEDCVVKLMKEKGLTRDQAETAYAVDCAAMKTEGSATAASGCSAHGAASATATSASGCPYAKMTTAAVTTAATKSCSGDKEACIAKCMAEKGLTRAQAEACYDKCKASMAEGKACPGAGVNMIQTAVATDGTPMHSREACVDACIAKGMTRVQAEACAAKCEATGCHSASATQIGDTKSTCPTMKASATSSKAGCCSKSKASASEAEATTPAGGSN
jgi:hypothetical protein